MAFTNESPATTALFLLGDLGGGAIIGAATAAAVRAVITPECDMAIAMLGGMAIGTSVHVLLGLLLVPLLGLFHTMVSAGLVGMYGGMLFAMRDCMQARPDSMSHTLVVGAGFGVVVVAGVSMYDRILRGPEPPQEAQ